MGWRVFGRGERVIEMEKKKRVSGDLACGVVIGVYSQVKVPEIE